MRTREVEERECQWMSIRRVIVTASLRQGCERTIRYAAEVAGHFNASLYLVHVFWPSAEEEGDSRLIDEEQTRRRDWLEDLAGEVGRFDPDCKPVFLIGELAECIAALARRVNADLIVTATHHASLLGRLFSLDKAAKIMQKAPCSVPVNHDKIDDSGREKDW